MRKKHTKKTLNSVKLMKWGRPPLPPPPLNGIGLTYVKYVKLSIWFWSSDPFAIKLKPI